MKIQPYPKREERWRKVLKHVFNPGEAWWQVFGDFTRWHGDWTTLRQVGISSREGLHVLVGEHPSAQTVVDRNHDAWLTAAERAVDQAIAARRVEVEGASGKRRYRGDLGVLVITSWANHLVTCFRPRELVRPSTVGVTGGGGIERAAVRRDQRRASLQATRDSGPEEENDHAS